VTVGASTSQPITFGATDLFSQPRNTRTLVSTQALDLLHQHLMVEVGRGNPPQNPPYYEIPNQPVVGGRPLPPPPYGVLGVPLLGGNIPGGYGYAYGHIPQGPYQGSVIMPWVARYGP